MNRVSILKNSIIGVSSAAMLTCASPKITAKAVNVIIPNSAPHVENVLKTNIVAGGLRDNLLYGVPASGILGSAIGFFTSIATGVKKKKEILNHTLEGASTGAQLSIGLGPFISSMIPGLAGGVGTAIQTGIASTTITFQKRVYEQTLRIAAETIEKNRLKR